MRTSHTIKNIFIIVILIVLVFCFANHVTSKNDQFFEIQDCMDQLNEEIGLNPEDQYNTFYQTCINQRLLEITAK